MFVRRTCDRQRYFALENGKMRNLRNAERRPERRPVTGRQSTDLEHLRGGFGRQHPKSVTINH